MKIAVCALAALSLAACTTVQVPNMRPLNASQIAAMGPTPVVVAENNDGVAKSWLRQDSSAAGASQGVLGVLIAGAMDGIMNYVPGHRAGRQANELAEVMTVDTLNASAADHFRNQIIARRLPASWRCRKSARSRN